MKSSVGRYETAEKRWAGVGPYYAMFPAAFANKVINDHCSEGGTVLDPFAGRGTAVFSAAVSGRRALGVELNPVGWVYSRTKLAPADKELVERRIGSVQSLARHSDDDLPAFFRHCFMPHVRRFLIAARRVLNWRQSSVDRTLMAFLLIHLHGKSADSMSNQMRQTKSMSPDYAVRWWKERNSKPPDIDIQAFLKKKLDWRYAKGIPQVAHAKVYLGDSTAELSSLKGRLTELGLARASLILTSPPYFGITNYHYDQWLRLWLLGGPPSPKRANNRFNGKYRRKFENLNGYIELLNRVFGSAAELAKKDCVVYVRTDKRQPTQRLTRRALKIAFPDHHVHRIERPVGKANKTQTELFGNDAPRLGEIDYVLTK